MDTIKYGKTKYSITVSVSSTKIVLITFFVNEFFDSIIDILIERGLPQFEATITGYLILIFATSFVISYQIGNLKINSPLFHIMLGLQSFEMPCGFPVRKLHGFLFLVTGWA